MRFWFYHNEHKAIKFARMHSGRVMNDMNFGYYVYVPDEQMKGKIQRKMQSAKKVESKQ